MNIRTCLLTFSLVASSLLHPSAVSAQPAPPRPPQLPPPEATDPVALKLMQGFPPPPDKLIQLSNVLQYPNSRWAFHHMRELGPTATIWRGAGPVSPLNKALRPLDDVRFDDGQGGQLSVLDWQRRTYTDALVVMHRGQVVYERYDVGMQPWQPHALWSMSKSLTGLLATQLIQEGRIDPPGLGQMHQKQVEKMRIGPGGQRQMQIGPLAGGGAAKCSTAFGSALRWV